LLYLKITPVILSEAKNLKTLRFAQGDILGTVFKKNEYSFAFGAVSRVAKEIGVSQVQVSRIGKKVLRTMRESF